MKYISTIGFILFFTINCNSQDFWEPVSLPDSIEPYTVFLTDEGDFLLGTFEHGIYITEDDGMTWQHMGIAYGIYNIVQMSNGDLYAGANSGISKSVDGGQTWYEVVVTDFAVISFYCSTQDHLFIGTWGGIHKSIDSGYTWTQVHQSTSSHVFRSFTEKEDSLYSGSEHYLGDNSGIYCSVDGGNSWDIWSMSGIGINPLTIDNNEYLLGGVATTYPNGIFRVSDNGQSWDELYGGADVVSILPDESNGIYIGLESDVGIEWGVRYSHDNGSSWDNISSGMEYSARVIDLEFNFNNYLFAVTSSPRSLYRSINPIVGIQDYIYVSPFKTNIFPNPFINSIKVDLLHSIEGEKVVIEVYNIHSGLIERVNYTIDKNNQSIEINLDDQPPGLFIVNVSCLDYHKSHILIKSN